MKGGHYWKLAAIINLTLPSPVLWSNYETSNSRLAHISSS